LGALILSIFPATSFSLIAVILALPLVGAFVNGVWGKRLGNSAVRLMALVAVGGSFLAALVTFIALVEHVDAEKHEHVKLAWTAWNWMHTTGGHTGGNVPIDARFSVDALSGVMMLVVTGVGFLIHLYATEYMAEDPGFARFFAYLNLFVFAMLVLILADNLPVLFVGWEGVGLCSYLLIGFWYDKMPNAAAGKKAFIANRVGDFGLICGMFLLVWYTGALDWTGIAAGAASLRDTHVDSQLVHLWPVGGGVYDTPFAFLQPGYMQAHHIWILQSITPSAPITISAATAVGLALLLGCTGKSAQIPLYVWLPDAMAGPTPVSALIHAATMVTAGVYLICRLSFIFVMSPFVMMIIACIGAATALFAATIALVQNDIKKVLAYSTISQLGFMFLGVGVGAFTAGFFHVFTHAFFKACLFLCAGSVIHAMHARVHDDDRAQDMRYMGGLRKYMPITYWSFFASTLAIAGCPLTSGFFSKDEILYRAFVDTTVNPFTEALTKQNVEVWVPPHVLGPMLYLVGLSAAVMTAFYMFRALFLTFWGDFRGWTIGRPSLLAKEEHDGGDHHEDLSSPGYPPRESRWPMTVPLIVLATCSIVAGFIFNAGPIPIALLHSMDHWLDPVFEPVKNAIIIPEGAEKTALVLLVPGIAAFFFGSGLAWWMYVSEKGKPARRAADAAPRLHTILLNKWYVDELYDIVVVAAVDALADTCAAFDQFVVDGLIAKVPAFFVAISGSILRAFQTGVVHVYAAFMAIGLAAFGWFFIVPHPVATVASVGTDTGDYVVTAAPGMGYQYRWDADGNGQFDSEHTSNLSSVKVHLDEGQDKNLLIEATSVFGITRQATVPISRPKSTKPMQVGLN
jgi:NADH-quinone oxidoreductase subunit L